MRRGNGVTATITATMARVGDSEWLRSRTVKMQEVLPPADFGHNALGAARFMYSMQPMNRRVVKLTTLEQQGKDAGAPDATPEERLMMVWPLTLTTWKFKEPNVVQPRLQRHVARTLRRQG